MSLPDSLLCRLLDSHSTAFYSPQFSIALTFGEMIFLVIHQYLQISSNCYAVILLWFSWDWCVLTYADAESRDCCKWDTSYILSLQSVSIQEHLQHFENVLDIPRLAWMHDKSNMITVLDCLPMVIVLLELIIPFTNIVSWEQDSFALVPEIDFTSMHSEIYSILIAIGSSINDVFQERLNETSLTSSSFPTLPNGACSSGFSW